MKHIFLSSLRTCFELPDPIVNYRTRSKLAIASAAMQHDAASASVQLALHRKVVHP